MYDTAFTAMLKTGKLTARAEETKTIRRVQFSLVRDFTVADAEWLGTEAMQLRTSLQNGTLNRFEIPIDAYHAKATFHGRGGNVDIDVDGITATAAVVGSDENEHEEVAYLFEAFPDAKLLTFLASSLKEHIDCEFKRTQTQMNFGEKDSDKGKKGKSAEKGKSAKDGKGAQMSLGDNPKPADGAKSAESEKPAADKSKNEATAEKPKTEAAAQPKKNAVPKGKPAEAPKKTTGKGKGLTYKLGEKLAADQKPAGAAP